MSSLLLSVLAISLSLVKSDILIESVTAWIQDNKAFTNITCSDGITGMGQMGKPWRMYLVIFFFLPLLLYINYSYQLWL